MTKRWFVMLLLLAISPLATASAQRGGGEIYVTSATYGGNCGAPRNNVLHGLINACGGRQNCRYTVDWRMIGDPRPGCGKDFHVSWTCYQGQQERHAVLNPEASGQSVFLDCRR
jgi:hypothetical protein